jgi:O-acetylhomoserine/O-acetylserine sulfhydrylase-like pyridoxal-dependent enzyme
MSGTDDRHFKTREVRAGVRPDPVTGAILTPIYQTTTYVQESVDRYLEKGYSYSRSGNPTVSALEEKITALEGGVGSLCFATGMAATSCTIMGLVGSGDHAILSDVVYGGTHRVIAGVSSAALSIPLTPRTSSARSGKTPN